MVFRPNFNGSLQLSLLSNRFSRRVNLLALFLTLLTHVTIGCGGRRVEVTPNTADADILLFDLGQEALADDDWTRAREYFIQIRDNYPQSTLRADARLGVADSYEGEATPVSYVSALTELRDFLALYPTHERAGYAQYKVGMVFFNQMRRPERDQSETREAVREFETFIQNYAATPDNELLNEVRAKLREARDQLSESSFIIGRFYYRNEFYSGAISRFQEILDNDPGYTGRDAVYFHLADSLAITEREAEALPMFERLVDEFPETEYHERATERIARLKIAMNINDR